MIFRLICTNKKYNRYTAFDLIYQTYAKHTATKESIPYFELPLRLIPVFIKKKLISEIHYKNDMTYGCHRQGERSKYQLN